MLDQSAVHAGCTVKLHVQMHTTHLICKLIALLFQAHLPHGTTLAVMGCG